MKMSKMFSLMLKLVIPMILLLTFDMSECFAETDINSNLEPGKVYHCDELPKGGFDFQLSSRFFWGENVRVYWMTVPSDSYIQSTLLRGKNSLFVVMNGPVAIHFDKKEIMMHEMDCLYLEEETSISFTTDKDSAEILRLLWPITTPTSKPYVTPGEIFNINDQQFCKLTHDVYSRIVQFSKEAQLCHLWMAPGGEFIPTDYTGELFLYITRGSIEKTCDGSTVQMKKYDFVYFPGEMAYTLKAGPEGCEGMALFTPARLELTEAMKESYEKFNSIIPPDMQPELVIDAERDNLDISFAEGPSWMDGKLYFSGPNLHVLDPDGSCAILNSEYPINGTFPLPNGNIAACCMNPRSIVEISPAGDLVRTIADSYEGEALPGAPNDLVVDKKGGIYFTIFSGQRTAVFYINPKGKLMKVTEWDKYGWPNGCILSPDGSRFYLNTAGDKMIWVFDVNENGTLYNSRIFAKKYFKGGDGMAIDRQENLYVITRGCVEIFDSNGDFIGYVKIPGMPTNCCFGGQDLSTLYVTSRQLYVTNRHRIYSVKTNTKGLQYPIR